MVMVGLDVLYISLQKKILTTGASGLHSDLHDSTTSTPIQLHTEISLQLQLKVLLNKLCIIVNITASYSVFTYVLREQNLSTEF